MLKNNSKYKLNKKQANEMLQNVFKTCDVEPSSDSFDKLILKDFAKTQYVLIARYIAIFFLVICAISPLCIKKDEYFVVMKNNTHKMSVIIEDHELFEDHFTMTLFGDDILYGNIYAYSNENLIFPTKVDIKNSTVTFPYDGNALDIHIPVKSGEELNAILSEKDK